MANVYPTQERAIDPYASYESNCTNRLTRMVSNGKNCLLGPNSLQVTVDPAHPTTHLILGVGKCFKDDVLIEVTTPFSFDTTDFDFYLPSSGGRDIVGRYYIVLEYNYVKARPAPRASIKILKPSQHGVLGGYIFLKAMDVVFNSGSGQFETGTLYDWDPLNPTTAQRPYNDLYAAAQDTVPVWVPNDEGRIIYAKDEDELYFGTETNWESFSGVRDNTNTTGTSIGQIGYFHGDGTIHPAISTSPNTLADCVTMSLGVTDGKVRLVGRADKVPIQTGVTVVRGDKVYLSQTQAGTVTTPMPITGIAQKVGTCIRNNGDGTIYMWFLPSTAQDQQLSTTVSNIDSRVIAIENVMPSVGKIVRADIATTNWSNSLFGVPQANYFVLIPYSFTNRYCVVQCYSKNNGTQAAVGSQIQPIDIVCIPSLNPGHPWEVLIWMPNNTWEMHVVIIGN